MPGHVLKSTPRTQTAKLAKWQEHENCLLCGDGFDRHGHLVYLSILEQSDNDGRGLKKGSPGKVLKDLTKYVNKNLNHLNHTQIHFRIFHLLNKRKLL